MSASEHAMQYGVDLKGNITMTLETVKTYIFTVIVLCSANEMSGVKQLPCGISWLHCSRCSHRKACSGRNLKIFIE